MKSISVYGNMRIWTKNKSVSRTKATWRFT